MVSSGARWYRSIPAMKHATLGIKPAIAKTNITPAAHSVASSNAGCPAKSRYRQLALAGTVLQNCAGKPDIPAKLRETRTHSAVTQKTSRAAAKFRDEEGANQNRSQSRISECGDDQFMVADTGTQVPARSWLERIGLFPGSNFPGRF